MKINQQIFAFLKSYSFDPHKVNRLIVSTFLRINKLHIANNELIQDLIIKDQNEELVKLDSFINLFEKNDQTLRFEELIELFEFVISPADKEVNGAVYTPQYIREYIVAEVIKKLEKQKTISNLKFGDIACGCGGFFITIVNIIKQQTNKNYFEIYKDNIFGLDIQSYSIERTKILLTLLAILNGEDCTEFDFNLFLGNALDFDWKSVQVINENNGFDIIVGNPPYVGSTKIDNESKQLLKNWSVSSSGKSDLYIPFFEIGIENLNNTGILGYITVNTFYRSLNGRSVRSYFSKNKFDLSIVDFGGEQLFKKRSTYTCICIIGKTPAKGISYVKTASDNIGNLKSKDFFSIKYDSLNDFDGWHLISEKRKQIISKIENAGVPLGKKFEIRNGFATLHNDLYVFKPIRETEDFYFLEKDSKEFKIEKGICRNAIKPNTLKSELEIERNTEKLIFPYTIVNGEADLFDQSKRTIKIVDEVHFKNNYPNAYKYLLFHKEELSMRDKGGREYEIWYAFGRNQALTLHGYKLLFPYISSNPCFVYTENKDFLFYNGYAILSESVLELKIIQKILMSKIFWYYIKYTSKPYSGKFFSLAKNYVKNFGICTLTEQEKEKLLELIDPNEIDDFLMQKYEIQIDGMG
ncbi:MAG: Eco57I restriction-modification methylase domain-containing protein [Paludibacter sp.]